MGPLKSLLDRLFLIFLEEVIYLINRIVSSNLLTNVVGIDLRIELKVIKREYTISIIYFMPLGFCSIKLDKHVAWK